MITSVSTVINAPVERVWSVLGDFTTWHEWLPVLASTTMADGLDQAPVGSVRILTTPDGMTGGERLLAQDEREHVLTYSVEGPSPFPMRHYVSTVRLFAVTTSGDTFIQWTAEIDADAADEKALGETFRGIYLGFFDSLRAHLRAKA